MQQTFATGKSTIAPDILIEAKILTFASILSFPYFLDRWITITGSSIELHCLKSLIMIH
ncbi:MAG: hypothetical protein AB4060_11470 [Crocosphaera sp.]